jgi:hypothetical protein
LAEPATGPGARRPTGAKLFANRGANENLADNPMGCPNEKTLAAPLGRRIFDRE